MRCQKCGSKNASDAMFCIVCGEKLERNMSKVFNDVSEIYSNNNPSSVYIKDSIIIGDSGSEDKDGTKRDMEEAREGLELLRQLKSIKREDASGYQQIENEAKMAGAKIEIMKMEAEKAGERRGGELAALDIARTLNELRDQCVNDEAFAVKVTVEVLKKKVKDEKSLGYLESVGKMMDALYDDPFRKLEETHQTRVLELCNFIEEAYFASLVHGDGEN